MALEMAKPNKVSIFRALEMAGSKKVSIFRAHHFHWPLKWMGVGGGHTRARSLVSFRMKTTTIVIWSNSKLTDS